MLDETFFISLSDRLNHKPIIQKLLQNETVILGSNVTFEVTVVSDLHRSTHWIYAKCQNESDPLCNKTALQVMVELCMSSHFLYSYFA